MIVEVIASIAPPLAHTHTGHWVTLILFVPIVIAIALTAVQSVQGRRRGIQPAADPDRPDPPADPLER